VFVITATIRDLAIIFLALESIVVLALLGILIWQIWRLTKMLEVEFKPIIEDTQETISTVRGTAIFMSDNVVNPVVKGARTASRARYTAQALWRDLKPLRRSPVAPPVAPPPAPPPADDLVPQ